MIARLLILAGLLPMTVGVAAQVRGVTETGAVDASADAHMANAKRDVIKNISGVPIQALSVTFVCTTADGRTHTDGNGSVDRVFSYATDRFIPPGGRYLSQVIEPGDCTATTDAVVYADGRVEGDQDKINVIFERRNGAYQALAIVIPMLEDIASGELKARDAVAKLETSMQELSNDRSLPIQEMTGEGAAFAQTIALLKDRAWLRTPSDGTPNRQPRFKDLMQAKGMTLEEAQAFVTANKYREWQAALKDNLAPRGNY